MSETAEHATYKVGVNRGRRRIWIDGPRLKRAGFVPGCHYWASVAVGSMYLTLIEHAGVRRRTVSGRPNGKPIIDITGRDVAVAFPVCAAVYVRFDTGTICIVPSTRNEE